MLLYLAATTYLVVILMGLTMRQVHSNAFVQVPRPQQRSQHQASRDNWVGPRRAQTTIATTATRATPFADPVSLPRSSLSSVKISENSHNNSTSTATVAAPATTTESGQLPRSPTTPPTQPSPPLQQTSSLARLHELLTPSKSCDVARMSVTDLAYVGDVVYELCVRSQQVWPSKRTSVLQHEVVNLVCAEYQAYLLQQIRNSPEQQQQQQQQPQFLLTRDEERVVSRGRNHAASNGSRNRRRHRSDPTVYQDATALETLLGYLYLSDTDRCCQLLDWVRDEIIRTQQDKQS